MILRAAILTFRMHRFEVFAAGIASVLMGVTAWVVYQHLVGAAVSPECWRQYSGEYDDVDGVCRRAIIAFYRIRESEAGNLTGIAYLFPLALGVVAGVPVVGRELELRTASLSWSLSGNRPRWLLQRFLPMFGLVLAGLWIAAVQLSDVRRVGYVALDYPYLGELGIQGPTFVARGIMALGIALLAGALLGRTLPGLIVASVVALAVINVVPPTLHSGLARVYRVWVVNTGTNEGTPPLVYVQRGWMTSQGRFMNHWQGRHLFREQCPGCKPPQRVAWLEERMQRASRIVPIERYGEFELAQTATEAGIGIVAILLTFPVVARRRPA